MSPAAGPTRLTVLYDAGCPLCTAFRDWLLSQPTILALDAVPAGSPEAHTRFPALDHLRTQREITVVGDDGNVWTREHAWVMALWATRSHRALAERLARPGWLPVARAVAAGAAGLRHLLTTSTPTDEGGGYPDLRVETGACASGCAPLPQS